jgi:L-seryl-tRNA(Ser) seleniumtransferase
VTATLGLYRAGLATTTVPVWRMLATPLAELEARAAAMVARIGAPAGVAELRSTVGGGSLPGETLPSIGVALTVRPATRLAARLRDGDPVVVGRIEDGRVVLDLRTVDPSHDTRLAEVVEQALATGR